MPSARARARRAHTRPDVEASRPPSVDTTLTPVDRDEVPLLLDLDQERVALAAAGADRREAEPAAVAAKLVDHRPEDSRPRRADRMAERHGAAVHVHPV